MTDHEETEALERAPIIAAIIILINAVIWPLFAHFKAPKLRHQFTNEGRYQRCIMMINAGVALGILTVAAAFVYAAWPSDTAVLAGAICICMYSLLGVIVMLGKLSDDGGAKFDIFP